MDADIGADGGGGQAIGIGLERDRRGFAGVDGKKGEEIEIRGGGRSEDAAGSEVFDGGAVGESAVGVGAVEQFKIDGRVLGIDPCGHAPVGVGIRQLPCEVLVVEDFGNEVCLMADGEGPAPGVIGVDDFLEERDQDDEIGDREKGDGEMPAEAGDCVDIAQIDAEAAATGDGVDGAIGAEKGDFAGLGLSGGATQGVVVVGEGDVVEDGLRFRLAAGVDP